VLCDEKQALSASIDAAKSELAALLGPCTTAYAVRDRVCPVAVQSPMRGAVFVRIRIVPL
jgi:hypothetical protein